MRIRLIVAFIVVALLAALAALWFNDLIVPFYGWPSWLPGWVISPTPLVHLLYKHQRGTMPHPPAAAVIFYCLAAVGLLLAVLTAVAVRRITPGAAAGAAAGPGRAADVGR